MLEILVRTHARQPIQNVDMTKKRDLKFLRILERVAEGVAPVGSARIAAGLVYKNQFISVGINSRKTDPFQAKYGRNDKAICLHAEISSIKGFLKIADQELLRQATLYVCRVKHSEEYNHLWNWGNACPCVGCKRAIVDFGIKRVVYTLNGTNNFDAVNMR